MPSVVIRFIPPTHTIGARLPSGLARASVDVTKSMHCALITTRLPLSGYLQLLCPTAMAKGIQLGLTAKRPFACLNYSNRDVQHMPHHDCSQIYLRSAIAVCPHSDCIIALQLGLAAKRSLYRLALRLSFSLLLGPLTARVARRVSVPQYGNRTAFSLPYGWSHFDCFQATLLSAIAVCPQRLLIAFKLGLAAKRSL